MAEGFGLSTIGQIAVHVQDLERAVAFYRDRLGLTFLFQTPPGPTICGWASSATPKGTCTG